MPEPKDSALEIAALLASAHAAHPESPELDALHKALDDGLENFGGDLGLTDDDADEIRGVLTAARGGEPKPR